MKFSICLPAVTRLVGLSLLIATVVFAQEDTKKNYISKDTVVVIGERIGQIPRTNTTAMKLPVALRQTPASVSVVTNALLDNQAAIVLADALKNVSGINTQSGFGTFDYFVIRGFESLTNGLVLTDGAAEPEVTFYNLYNTERVEVLKGPGAFLYGGNPLSGTVNLVRKQPVFRNFLHAAASFGQFNSTYNTVDVGVANFNSGVAFRLNGLWQKSDSYRDNKDNDNFSLNPALTLRVNARTSFTVNYEYVNSEYAPDTGLPLVNNLIPNVPRTNSYQLPSDNSLQKISRARFDFETHLSPRVTLRNKFYFTDLDWQSEGTLIQGALPTQNGNALVFRSLTDLDDRQKLLGNQLEAAFNFNTGNLRHQLLAGVEWSRLNDDFSINIGLLQPMNLLPPQSPAVGSTFFPFMAADGRNVTLAPFFVNQITFSDKLQTVIGARYDRFNYKDSRQLFSQQIGAFNAPTKREYKKASPIVGVNFSPAPNWSLYANVGKAFGPPSSQTVGDLKAEESEQIEFGAKTQWLDGKLNATLAFYDIKKDNLTIPDYSGLAYNLGKQKSRGLELEMTLEPIRSWQTFVTYAFTDAELTEFQEDVLVPTQTGQTVLRFDRSGNAPAFAPKHIFNVWTNRELKQRFGIGAGARYLSEQFIDEDNAFKIDGIFLVDAMLYYNIGQWRWSLNAKNLLDTKYETRGFGAASVIPGNPFAIYGGVEFRL